MKKTLWGFIAGAVGALAIFLVTLIRSIGRKRLEADNEQLKRNAEVDEESVRINKEFVDRTVKTKTQTEKTYQDLERADNEEAKDEVVANSIDDFFNH